MDNETALKYADQVATALRGKFPEHTIYVRLIESPEMSYVELAAKNKKNNHENTVAYAVKYFYEMTDAELKQRRAKRIYADLKTQLGIE